MISATPSDELDLLLFETTVYRVTFSLKTRTFGFCHYDDFSVIWIERLVEIIVTSPCVE